MPDVIKLLESDHREVEDLFAKAASTSGAAKQQVVTRLATELTIHAEAEETIVYPAMREAGLGDLVDEAESEHEEVKKLVARLEAMDATGSDADPLLAELQGDVSHHVEEEESEGFPKFRSATDQDTLEALGTKVDELKHTRSV
jgi:hemerythrin superfamily protein